MADYIPAPDADFHAWQQNFVSYASGNLGALGLVAGDLTPVTTAQSTWGTAYPAHVSAQQNAQGATQTKKDARSAYVAALRPLVKRLQASAAADAAERANLGHTVPDTEPTPTGPPTTAPLGKIDCGQRLLHTINFMDETTPTSKSKPAGVLGAEIWIKIGSPAAGIALGVVEESDARVVGGRHAIAGDGLVDLIAERHPGAVGQRGKLKTGRSESAILHGRLLLRLGFPGGDGLVDQPRRRADVGNVDPPGEGVRARYVEADLARDERHRLGGADRRIGGHARIDVKPRR
jgi:hypothetical protein